MRRDRGINGSRTAGRYRVTVPSPGREAAPQPPSEGKGGLMMYGDIPETWSPPQPGNSRLPHDVDPSLDDLFRWSAWMAPPETLLIRRMHFLVRSTLLICVVQKCAVFGLIPGEIW